MKTVFIIFFSMASVAVYGNINIESLKSEIKRLSTKEEVTNYWLALHESDQLNSSSAEKYNDSVGVVNLYKATLLIHYHGYPIQADYGYPAYVTPWLVWVHCPSAAMAQYTFPMILQGRDLGQLPEGMFPNYFVGGFLLHLYNQDMQFDTSFNHNTPSIINTTLKQLEDEKHVIKPAKVKRLAKEYLAVSTAEVEQKLGSWKFLQHDDISEYSIVKLKNRGWYLRCCSEEGFFRPLQTDKKLQKYRFEDGFDMFNLVIVDDRLTIQHTDGTILKISQ